jgi:glycosyltransferase involved in cell wall biosynthesis
MAVKEYVFVFGFVARFSSCMLPSLWMKNCVSASKLMNDWPVTVIPNTIDTRIWKPKNKIKIRNKLKINNNTKTILFSALGGGKQHHKGKDLLIKSLKELNKKTNFEIIVVGENFSDSLSALGIKTHYLGHISDDNLLCDIYNCADVCVVPSRVESFCLTALEAQSCGVPVVSFNTCGLKDIIVNNKTGFLADSFNHKDLGKKILSILRDEKIHSFMSKNARNNVLKKFSYYEVVKKYNYLYKKIIKNH